MILGQLPPRKIAANAKINPNPYPKANWGGQFSKGAILRILIDIPPESVKKS